MVQEILQKILSVFLVRHFYLGDETGVSIPTQDKCTILKINLTRKCLNFYNSSGEFKNPADILLKIFTAFFRERDHGKTWTFCSERMQ